MAAIKQQLKFLSLFTGGGGADIGAIAAGCEVVLGVESDPAIADVYERNISAHVLRLPAEEIDPWALKGAYGDIDVIWASPPCQGYSTARSKSLPERTDKDVGLCVLDYVRAFEPSYVFLENVPPYQHSKTFKAIVAGLWEMGYWVHSDVVNAADYGVPQTRLRLIMRAVKGAMVMPLPSPVKWVGWYQAIEDLIPGLPETKFAPWQLKRLKSADLLQDVIVSRTGSMNLQTDKGLQFRGADDPLITLRASGKTDMATVYLVPGANQGQARKRNEPSLTVTTEDHGTRAYLLPAATYTQDKCPIVNNGCVVAMTVKALARFQSFPDWYEFPDNKALACKIIGNAVPPKMAQAIIEATIRGGA